MSPIFLVTNYSYRSALSLSVTAICLISQAIIFFHSAQAKPCNALLALPTDNHHLLGDDEERFYMYVYRTFEGQKSRPWTGGKYGFVRNKKRTNDGIICTKFHEGIDIKPIKRDSKGIPLDKVKTIAAGKVVYCNPISHHSSYGKYIVIEHNWVGGLFYSLYAHLSSITVKEGQRLALGDNLGTLGYTGDGLNRDRAHLHLELGIIFTSRFTPWHDNYFTDTNHHGNYNGINIAGLDIASFLMKKRNNSSLSIPQFVASMSTHYKVIVPRRQIREGTPEIVQRYPWMLHGKLLSNTPSVEIAFSASGFPIRITPCQRKTATPIVSWVRECNSKHEYHTKGFVSGTGEAASLSKSGRRFIDLVCGQFE